MKHDKMIESWKDVLVLISLILIALGILYAIFFCKLESYVTTGTWKSIEEAIQDYFKGANL